jgi:hypothetical protein
MRHEYGCAFIIGSLQNIRPRMERWTSDWLCAATLYKNSPLFNFQSTPFTVCIVCHNDEVVSSDFFRSDVKFFLALIREILVLEHSVLAFCVTVAGGWF